MRRATIAWVPTEIADRKPPIAHNNASENDNIACPALRSGSSSSPIR